jgi:prepilin signal peptidase PulO-like enzyme (type II secretory pathway)
VHAIGVIQLVIGVIALLYLAVIDLRCKIVPNKTLLLLLITRIMLYLVQFLIICVGDGKLQLFGVDHASIFTSEVSGSLLLGGFFMLIALKSGHALGFGDVKLMFILPLYFGLDISLLGVFFALLSMLVVSGVFIGLKKWSRKTQLPLVPCIACGFFLAILVDYFKM